MNIADNPNNFWVGTEPRYRWIQKRDHFPPLGTTAHLEDPIVRVRLFIPHSLMQWHLLEYDADSTIAVCLTKHPISMITSVKLSELSDTGLDIQRDLLFTPLPISQVWADRHVSV